MHTDQAIAKMKAKFAAFEIKYPYRFMEGAFNEDISGNYLNNCKNAHFCFDSRRLWDCRYMTQGFDDCRNCMDCTETGDGAELLYECSDIGYNSHAVLFSSHGVIDLNNLLYCYHCFNVQNCFGCIGLHHKKYCILNKQYTKAEYEELVPRIIAHMESTGEWGEFFPVRVSPFAYNETQAFIQNFPLSKAEVLDRGWKWKEQEDRIPQVEKSLPAIMLPDSVAEIPDDVLNWAILCAETGRPFLIQKPELAFYRQMNLPLPRYHFDVRHKARYLSRMPNQLYDRKCDRCEKQIETVYPVDFEGKVFCETCFQTAVE